MKKCIVTLLLISVLFMVLPGAAYANGLQADAVTGKVGDSITVSYVIPNRVDNVGAITLYLNYDSSVLKASDISPKKPPITHGDSDISRMAPREDSTGSIVASWVEVYCSMVLEPGFELLTVTFTFIADTEGTEISSAIILKGMASAGSNGNDDLTALAGVSNPVIKLSTKEIPGTTGTENDDSTGSTETVPETENSGDAATEEKPTPSEEPLIPEVTAQPAVTTTPDVPAESTPNEEKVTEAEEGASLEEPSVTEETIVNENFPAQTSGNDKRGVVIIALACVLFVSLCVAAFLTKKKKAKNRK